MHTSYNRGRALPFEDSSALRCVPPKAYRSNLTPGSFSTDLRCLTGVRELLLSLMLPRRPREPLITVRVKRLLRCDWPTQLHATPPLAPAGTPPETQLFTITTTGHHQNCTCAWRAPLSALLSSRRRPSNDNKMCVLVYPLSSFSIPQKRKVRPRLR
ncbi:hypothetical protein GY45DRAFT_353159 [Cubamyces sp. BRFM 1775]|nr:hypothetical protein GY45DRAFT_353159 [Cubamyces sp. BRFM 1775]